MQNATDRDLKSEIADMKERFPRLHESELFVAWFLKCFVADTEREAIESLVGGPGDKSLDAIFVDDPSKKVLIVQGKYRQRINAKAENRSDVTAFADIAQILGDKESFDGYLDGLEASAAAKLTEARKRIVTRGYSLQLYFVTTGRCSPSLCQEAARLARRTDISADLEVIDGKRVLRLLTDYLDGVAPPVPMLELEIESGNGVTLKGILHRFDSATRINTMAFPVNVKHIAQTYEQAGIRLFARNVRGFLGETAINKSMEETLKSEPEFFWYYNNGVTIICDEAAQTSHDGRDIVRIVNPQIINGQQTTRTLHKAASRNSKATVLVRVIRVPRDTSEESVQFDKLVSNIVAATNWQNAIKPSDLMANDRRQIDLERNLRKRDYQYLRKRQTKAEARRHLGGRYHFMIKKEGLAQAVAACDLDPVVVRAGKERLFEEPLYEHVFPNSDPNYFLPRHWFVGYALWGARGNRGRSYSKWTAANFVWQSVAQVLNTRDMKETFIRISERESQAALVQLFELTFRALSMFYRANRGKGKEVLDVSSFFRRKNLHREFSKFWTKRCGRFKKAFAQALKQFREELDERRQEA